MLKLNKLISQGLNRIFLLHKWIFLIVATTLINVFFYWQVGHKKLFLMDPEGKAHEMIPNCVLDFYITGLRGFFSSFGLLRREATSYLSLSFTFRCRALGAENVLLFNFTPCFVHPWFHSLIVSTLKKISFWSLLSIASWVSRHMYIFREMLCGQGVH